MAALPEVRFHIYPTDCDMLGHLNHATMLNFLERARWDVAQGRTGEGISAAVERIGLVLAEHFPKTATDTNELPDRPISL